MTTSFKKYCIKFFLLQVLRYVDHLPDGTWFNIKRLLKLNWKVKICHSYRETNSGTNDCVGEFSL